MLTKKIKSFTTFWNLLIIIILLLAFFIRVYRTEDLLGFYYDQGRDAKIIWELWHNGKTFLIGPVTGLPGIFLGPFYYYLIAPFYLVGGGNPVYPAVFVSLLVVIGLFVLYRAGVEIGGKSTGLLALLIGSFSGQLFMSSRWFSNPTPLFLTSILLFYSLIKIINSKNTKYWWLMVFLMSGISFHFESASAAFYLPVLLVFLIWQRKKITKQILIISGGLLFLTFLPQLLFNFRHDNILFKNIANELLKRDKGDGGIVVNLISRLKLFWTVYAEKIFLDKTKFTMVFSLLSLFGIIKLNKFGENKNIIKLFGIFILIPLFFYAIYRGNHGVLYDYYFTGYYLVWILLFSWGISWFWKKTTGKLLVLIFVLMFFWINLTPIKSRLTLDILDGKDIFLGNELMAVDWVFLDAAKRGEFNVDAYVPPVITHSYDYLFLWRGNSKYKDSKQILDRQVNLLYTLYEVDPPHPERLDAWLKRQENIGKIEEEISFGGITVQRRVRISDGN